MSLIDLIKPRCKKPKIFRRGELQIIRHVSDPRFKDDYSNENEDLDKEEHKQAELQTLMENMPPNLIPQYNELFLQIGWILFFSMTFPAGALFTILAGNLRMAIELRGMSEYKKKNEPAMIKDIGIWMDILELIGWLGIGICLYLIMFTSKKLDSIFDVDEHIMYYVAFGFLHVIMLTKYMLQEIIEDEPDWVVEDRENTEQRVKQVL